MRVLNWTVRAKLIAFSSVELLTDTSKLFRCHLLGILGIACCPSAELQLFVAGCARAAAGSNGVLAAAESPLVVCFGEMLVDFVPTVSGLSLAEAPAFKKAPGGAPANVAVGIARLGGSSAFVGKVMPGG